MLFDIVLDGVKLDGFYLDGLDSTGANRDGLILVPNGRF